MTAQPTLFDLPIDDQQAIYDRLRLTIAWHRGDSTVWFAWCCGALVSVDADKLTGDCPAAGCPDKFKPTRWAKVERPYGPFRAHTGEDM